MTSYHYGEELPRCFAALREAGKTVSTRQVADWVTPAKGLQGAERGGSRSGEVCGRGALPYAGCPW